jgi:hypothetical protein
MLNSFVLDFLFGLLILGLIVLFHVLTKGLFIPTISFEDYNSNLIHEFSVNRSLLIFYGVSISIHILIAGVCVIIRSFLFDNPIGLLDIFLMCVTAPLVYVLFSFWSDRFLFSVDSELNLEGMTGLTKADRIQTFLRFAIVLKAYFLSVIVLLIGGLIGWLISQSIY